MVLINSRYLSNSLADLSIATRRLVESGSYDVANVAVIWLTESDKCIRKPSAQYARIRLLATRTETLFNCEPKIDFEFSNSPRSFRWRVFAEDSLSEDSSTKKDAKTLPTIRSLAKYDLASEMLMIRSCPAWITFSADHLFGTELVLRCSRIFVQISNLPSISAPSSSMWLAVCRKSRPNYWTSASVQIGATSMNSIKTADDI